MEELLLLAEQTEPHSTAYAYTVAFIFALGFILSQIYVKEDKEDK